MFRKIKACFYAILAIFTGKNSELTPVDTIRAQLLERRALPIGRTEFEEWSDRLISGCLIPGVDPESIKVALADQILHLGPTEDHKEDAFFIHSLRKFAVNQTADEMRKEIRDKAKARLAASEEAAKKLLPAIFPDKKTSEVTPTPKESVTDVPLANSAVS